MKVVIDNELTLKGLEVSDAAALYQLTNSCRPYLRKWLPWVDATLNVDDTRAFIELAMRQAAANNGFHSGIWFKGALVGVIGFHRVDWPNRSTSIGYWLGEAYQGLGIMARACLRMVEYAFREMHMNRVEIRCAVENLRSRAIPERLGFHNEGILREAEWLYDHYVDHVVYAMLAREWQAQREGAQAGVAAGTRGVGSASA